MFFIGHIKSSLILGRSFPHERIVLSLVKLKISDFSTKKKMSAMNILEKAGLILSLAVSVGKYFKPFAIWGTYFSSMLSRTKVIQQKF